MDRILVTGGRLDHRTDVATACWAFDLLRYTEPGLWLTIVGDGPEQARLERHARAVAIEDYRVRFTPITLAQLTASEQVWVTHRIGGEKLALAAMATGRPVLAADTPELRETLGDTALYFPPGDRVRLAALARSLIDHPDEAAARGDAGRCRGNARFPMWRMADALAAVYHEVGAHPAD